MIVDAVPVRTHPAGGVETMTVSETDIVPFGDIYAANAAGVYRFCLSQLRNASDAEDVTAEVFASAFAAYRRAYPRPDTHEPEGT